MQGSGVQMYWLDLFFLRVLPEAVVAMGVCSCRILFPLALQQVFDLRARLQRDHVDLCQRPIGRANAEGHLGVSINKLQYTIIISMGISEKGPVSGNPIWVHFKMRTKAQATRCGCKALQIMRNSCRATRTKSSQIVRKHDAKFSDTTCNPKP